MSVKENIGVQNRIPSIMFIKPTRIHLKEVWNSSHCIFLKDEVEQQQLVYSKNKVFTITDTGWQPPQYIDIAPKKKMVWQKELIVFALQGMKFHGQAYIKINP
jgi:hypothetical protein